MSGTTTDSSSFSGERVLGRVKWFNNRAGFGFISVLEGEKTGEDVFTHHSGISVESEQYKYLVQGEYVEFELRASDNEEHPYQAGGVKGVKGGWLMCETRMAMRRDSNKEGEWDKERKPRQTGGRRSQPRRGGGGPRDGDGGPRDGYKNYNENSGRHPGGKCNVKPSQEDQ